MKLIIEDDEGRKTVVPLIRDEMTIGRQDGNTIRLTERNVSRRHARLVKEDGNVLVEDLGSYNGVRVNGEKISGRTRIKEGDLVEIGDYDLGIQGKFDGPVTTPSMGTPRQATIPPGSMKAAAPSRSHPTTSPNLAAAPAGESVERTLPPDTAPPVSSTTPNAAAGGPTAIIRVSDLTAGTSSGEARDLERSQMPRLVGLAGPFRGKEFYLMRSEVKFGRTDENDIVADHQSVSRAHARFALEEGQWKVIDNKSANGVRVNGEEYAVSSLKPGDVLELGHLKFRFCAPGEKFSPPPEKTEDGAPKGGLKPTTAELIAAAQGRQAGAPAKKAGAPAGKIVALVVALAAVAAAAAYFVTRDRKSASSESGEESVKAADALFKQRKYIAASELYEKAGNAPAPNRKKAAEEAKGEEAFNSMKAALDAGDGDKARSLFERCGSETTYWCQKAQEQADAVKAAYAKNHLAKANAAKSAGKLETCLAEASGVLGFDASSSEAQALQTQCRPHEAARPEPARPEAPSAKDREAKASRLARLAHEKLMARDFAGAVKDAHAALSQSPADKNTVMVSYQSLGYGYAYLNDKPNAVKWLEKYLPYCNDDCDQVHAFIGK